MRRRKPTIGEVDRAIGKLSDGMFRLAILVQKLGPGRKSSRASCRKVADQAFETVDGAREMLRESIKELAWYKDLKKDEEKEAQG